MDEPGVKKVLGISDIDLEWVELLGNAFENYTRIVDSDAKNGGCDHLEFEVCQKCARRVFVFTLLPVLYQVRAKTVKKL